MKRRTFIYKSAQASLAVGAMGVYACNSNKKKELPLENKAEIIESVDSLFFQISLAQWSLNRSLRSGKMTSLEFAAKSRELGCTGIEYVNTFFKDKAKDTNYLNELNAAANGEGQQNVLIMIDQEGSMAHADTDKRIKAIENHYKWVDAAHHLGCHAIRVNLAGGKNMDDAVLASIDSLHQLSDYSKDAGINILVENHGGFSSNGAWMQKVFSQVKNENCGTLPDFGNFCVKGNREGCVDEYDRYKGMEELLPFAKAVSAKAYQFDENGDETTIDFYRIMKLVKKAGYTGFVGIEYEGDDMSEEDGIIATRKLLEKSGNI